LRRPPVNAHSRCQRAAFLPPPRLTRRPTLSAPLLRAQDWSKKHELDRKRITRVVCALCALQQDVGEACTGCGAAFGAYACTRCPFYDDDLDKQTFHCDDCGICRVGGRDHYFHCATCGSCYAANLRVSRRHTLQNVFFFFLN
jgi:hypothetical protein